MVDVKKLEEELMKTAVGKEMILDGLINNMGGVGYFALHKIERLVKEGLTNGVVDAKVGNELLETINIAYNFIKTSDIVKNETEFSRELSEMITIQKDIYKREDEKKLSKNKMK